MEGFKWHFGQNVLTVWSAPNYCYRCRSAARARAHAGRCGNSAAILEFDETKSEPYEFKIFVEAPEVCL